ncbi:hypothetical protein BDY24DRAFT_377600 [Mrakia frigida]|uniref:uncharacterized protein n=1 Tax=Mrakia frigida TaxID=29902 RepID=UPI003FCBF237
MEVKPTTTNPNTNLLIPSFSPLSLLSSSQSATEISLATSLADQVPPRSISEAPLSSLASPSSHRNDSSSSSVAGTSNSNSNSNSNITSSSLALALGLELEPIVPKKRGASDALSQDVDSISGSGSGSVEKKSRRASSGSNDVEESYSSLSLDGTPGTFSSGLKEDADEVTRTEFLTFWWARIFPVYGGGSCTLCTLSTSPASATSKSWTSADEKEKFEHLEKKHARAWAVVTRREGLGGKGLGGG